MSRQLKKIFACLAFAAFSAPAGASITQGSAGNGELFLTVVDPANMVSYSKDLGVNIGNLAAAGASAWNLASDALWSSFVALADNISNLRWAVVGVDANGNSASPGSETAITTTNAQAATIGTTTNHTLHEAVNTTSNYAGALNHQASNSTHAGQADGSSFYSAAASGKATNYAFNNDNSFNENFNFLTPFSQYAAVGTAQNLYRLSIGQGGGGGLVNVAAYNGAQAQLSADGVLRFTAPVPEPGIWGMLVAGLLALGAIARRRLSSDR